MSKNFFFSKFMLLAAVAALHCSAAKVTKKTKVTFAKDFKCPCSTTGLTKLHTLHTAASCFVECAAKPNCSLLHHKPSESACYLADNQQMPICLQVASNDSNPCESFVRRRTAMDKMLLFYDFRVSYLNQVDASRFAATPRGSVTRNSTGAHFPDDAASYIEVDTQANTLASTFLNKDRNFSFFARYERRTYFSAYVHLFHDCNNSSQVRASFGDREGKLWVMHMFPTASASDRSEFIESSAPLVPTDNSLAMVSIGATFTGATFTGFYHNGSVTAHTNLGWGYRGEPLCMGIGLQEDTSKKFNGRIICYGIAGEALTEIEMAEIDAQCH